MAFCWNGVHVSEVGIIADATVLPFLPEPKIATDEVPARDGFYDFSAFNNNRRVHYRPREWSFRCSLPGVPGASLDERVSVLSKMFMQYDGYLEVDKCPGVRWKAIITNRFDLVNVAITLRTFDIYFQSQAFADGLVNATESFSVLDGDTIEIINPGTWHTRPDVYLTGVAADASIGGIPIPNQGTLDDTLVWCPELKPGGNSISVKGFTGTARFDYTPKYIWGVNI